jgi:hypothetical protein
MYAHVNKWTKKIQNKAQVHLTGHRSPLCAKVGIEVPSWALVSAWCLVSPLGLTLSSKPFLTFLPSLHWAESSLSSTVQYFRGLDHRYWPGSEKFWVPACSWVAPFWTFCRCEVCSQDLILPPPHGWVFVSMLLGVWGGDMGTSFFPAFLNIFFLIILRKATLLLQPLLSSVVCE